MGQTIQADRTHPSVPLSMHVDRDGGITGLTVAAKIYNGADLTEFLDFADGTFKSAGHATPTLDIPEVSAANSPGFYAVDGGFDLSAITIPAAALSLFVHYDITAGGESGNDVDTIQLDNVRDGLEAQGYTATRAPNLDNLDATVSSRSSHTAANVDTTLSSSHGAGSWITATGFSTHSAADVDTTLSSSHGAGAWVTASGFAVPGSAMALTSAERTTLLGVFDTAHGVGSWVGAGLTAAQAIQLQEAWTALGMNTAAPASFDAVALFVRALANVTPIDVVISVVGTTVTLTRQP